MDHSRCSAHAVVRNKPLASSIVGKDAGQATVEWSALVLVVALTLGFGAYVTRRHTQSLGSALIHAIVCAANDGCPDALEDAYGRDIAQKLQRFAPNIVYERGSVELPVDFRRCRELACSNGSDRPVAIAESALGQPVAAFTHVVDRHGRGGAVYLQYWLYFPESY